MAKAPIRAAAAILALATAAQAGHARSAPAPGPRDCRPAPVPAQPCFSVRGRLSVWSGTPTFRLRPDGSKRVLGVAGGDGGPASALVLTPALRAAMTPPSAGELQPVAALFHVCPLAPDRPGRMRPVCIADATKIVLSPQRR